MQCLASRIIFNTVNILFTTFTSEATKPPMQFQRPGKPHLLFPDTYVTDYKLCGRLSANPECSYSYTQALIRKIPR